MDVCQFHGKQTEMLHFIFGAECHTRIASDMSISFPRVLQIHKKWKKESSSFFTTALTPPKLIISFQELKDQRVPD